LAAEEKAKKVSPQARPMLLKLHALTEHAPKVVPARPKRRWMDDFPDKHAYRCLPLSIANAYGWEVLCPVPIEIRWNGGYAVEDIQVIGHKPLPSGAPIEHFCKSNFSRGIITFHLDYVIETEPDWELLATGPFNDPKETAAPLTGIMESDWLPYPFTMNWQLLQPGITRFEEDEPFCSFFPIPKRTLPNVQVEIHRLADDPELTARHDQFKNARMDFMRRIYAGDPDAQKEAWQRHYFVGRHPDGSPAPEHVNKLRLSEPVDRRGAPVEPPRVRVRVVKGARAQEAATPQTPSAATPAAERGPELHAFAEGQVYAAGAEALEAKGRWSDDSPLARVPVYKAPILIPNREKIDAEGRLTPGPHTRYVGGEAEAKAAGLDFLVADDVLSREDCAALCRAFDELQELVFTAEEIDTFWNKRGVWLDDVAKHRPEAAALMRKGLRAGLGRMRRFWKLTQPVYADGLHLMSWKAGLFMAPHADNAYPDGKDHQMGYRDFSGVIYLNGDYEGGELYLTAQDVVVSPKPGMFVSMSGGFHHEHGVLRVEQGLRMTLPFFVSFDRARGDPQLVDEAETAAGG
jgi:hypothetical protein